MKEIEDFDKMLYATKKLRPDFYPVGKQKEQEEPDEFMMEMMED